MSRRNAYDMRPNSSDTWGGMGDSDKKKDSSPAEKPKRSIEEHPAIKAARERALSRERGSGIPTRPTSESPKTPEKKPEPSWNEIVDTATDLVPDAILTRFLTSLAEDRGRTTGIAAQVYKETARMYGPDKVATLDKAQFVKVLRAMPGSRAQIVHMLDYLASRR